MSAYDYERPFISIDELAEYEAIDRETARRFGKRVKATPLSNSEYNTRFNRLHNDTKMKEPPSIGRKFLGYLVVRNLGTAKQYETWMPEHVFEESYRPVEERRNELADSHNYFTQALLPGVPAEVLDRYRRAAGNELDSGKFLSPQSSASLAANTFGFFMNRSTDLPALPGWTAPWRPRRVTPEEEVRFPWTGGHHPWLDAVIESPEFLIGIESKRYEPFESQRARREAPFSEAYWRDEWGKGMHPYQWVRDGLAHRPALFRYVNAAQLVKHAFGLRTQSMKRGVTPVLAYVFAQPSKWPDGTPISQHEHAAHVEEIRCFARLVEGADVQFMHFSYFDLFGTFDASPLKEVRQHASHLRERFHVV